LGVFTSERSLRLLLVVKVLRVSWDEIVVALVLVVALGFSSRTSTRTTKKTIFTGGEIL
jgi:hypothetical protein